MIVKLKSCKLEFIVLQGIYSQSGLRKRIKTSRADLFVVLWVAQHLS